MSDPILVHVLRLALEEASTWLAHPECQTVLHEFVDESGRPLIERMTAAEQSDLSYLELLLFRDVPDSRFCASSELARTAPGSRLVFVCGATLIASWSANPRHVVAGIVHEALHSLGLRENPPSSAEITRRILSRCPGIQEPRRLR